MTPNLIILYVDDPDRSAAFYESLLGARPVERSPAFAMFIFPGGIKLGLWSRKAVEPVVAGGTGAFEIDVPLSNAAEVDAVFARLSTAGHTILLTPTDMEFGRNFVVADPDHHRIRFYNPPV
ncbi:MULTISPECIES: VOC family protein [Alphaproteobacteria]|uniref:Drug:proton antiporter n=2 Tax=Alphaproteobacteria TaxID=28211 RepID=A0A512HJ07_9HYPH|nr:MULTISPECIES: VOC family protein [Alphaproteobacteria]GEO85431.1 drug:proton antiporter [Ciceribacter naphthalenivorans]GLR21547.1 drug:proton antiporter [Ciceribacter naphthalenivorans]GLT04403.1 drug:proton antiporter [Sphingomonas psychrolutea]